MSDLVEKLKDAKKRLKGYPNPEECFTRMTLDLSEISTLLSALETVRGIEEIASQSRISISRGEMLSREGKSLWCVGQGMIGHYGETLSAAVEAARKQ